MSLTLYADHDLGPAAKGICDAFLARIGSGSSHSIQCLGNNGGFSGAALWKIQADEDSFCLRAWPGVVDAKRVEYLHRWMAPLIESGIQVVPKVFPLVQEQSWVQEGGRIWEITQWMPGRAIFHDDPSMQKLEAVISILARIHMVWSGAECIQDSCPAVARRVSHLRGWTPERLDRAHRQLRRFQSAHWADLAHHGLELLRKFIPPSLSALEPYRFTLFPVSPSLCDIRHDHLLFEEEDLTGIVDFGAMRMDNVAADLARLLDSLLGDDFSRRSWAVRKYQEFRPLSPKEVELIDVLDWTGVVVGIGNWLRWLLLENRHFENWSGVRVRLDELVSRLDGRALCEHGELQ